MTSEMGKTAAEQASTEQTSPPEAREVHKNGTDPDQMNITVTDQGVTEELMKVPDPERNAYANTALRIGMTALKQAQGQAHAREIENAGERVVREMVEVFQRNQADTIQRIETSIGRYFDPNDGSFNQRIKNLLGNEQEAGELERLIRRQLEGEESPLSNQQKKILKEFTLDNRESALSRLVEELKKNHGETEESLGKQITGIAGEFSLDRKDSALSRMMSQVEESHQKITREFSLDEENSSVSRMKKELLEVLEKDNSANQEFREYVSKEIAALNARKQEAERGPQHGVVFEESVFEFMKHRQKEGEIITHTGNLTGYISRNKKGDVVIELGPDHAAAGAKIVVEAKEDTSYNLTKSREELHEAKRNRGADVGLFVFSKKNVTTDMKEPLARFGNDIFVIWDQKDPSTDVYLDAAISSAKAISVQGARMNQTDSIDLEAIRKAVEEMVNQTNGLDEIKRLGERIEVDSGKILERARIVQKELGRQIGILEESVRQMAKGV